MDSREINSAVIKASGDLMKEIGQYIIVDLNGEANLKGYFTPEDLEKILVAMRKIIEMTTKQEASDAR